MLIDCQLTPAVGFESNLVEPQTRRIATAAIAPEKRIGTYLLTGLQFDGDTMRIAGDRFVVFVMANFYSVITQVIAQRIGDFIIKE